MSEDLKSSGYVEGAYPDLITEGEAAAMIGVHRRTLQVHRLADRPVLPYIMLGERFIRYDRADVVAALRGRLKVPANPPVSHHLRRHRAEREAADAER